MKEKTKKKYSKAKKRIYTCPHCPKDFVDQSSWRCHVKIHSTEEPYKCDLCPYKCKIKKYLSRHVKKTHSKPTAHQCQICAKCFHFECKLRDHMRVHTGEKPYKCDVCDKAFSSTYSLRGHKLIHTGEKPYQCMYCDYRCRDNSTIRKHQERHLGISKSYACSMCKKNFKMKSTLQLHVDEVHFELETRKFPCEQCKKVFKTKGTLRIHLKTVHTNANRVKCEICGCCVTKNNIQAHMRRHIDVKPYKCGFKPCGKRFKDKGDLKKHSYIHYPDRQHQCDICHRKFARKFRLNKHLVRMHYNRKNVECDYCGILSRTKTNLVRHIRDEHGPLSRKYICDFCGLVTFGRRSIVMHFRYGHGTENDTTCQICKKDYESYLGLKEHYMIQHIIKYSLLDKKKEDEPTIKTEPEEEFEEIPETVHVTPEFMYEVSVQKQEMDAEMLEPDTLPREDPSMYPIDADTITYSKKVLSEDVSRSLIERDNLPEDDFGDFFIGHVLKKPEDVVEMPKQIVDEKKKERVEKQLEQLLFKIRSRKQSKDLEKFRRKYNKRIKMATGNGIYKKEQKSTIRYYKKPEQSNESLDTHISNGNNEEGEHINKESDKNDEQHISENLEEQQTNKNDKSLNNDEVMQDQNEKQDTAEANKDQETNKNDESRLNDDINYEQVITRPTRSKCRENDINHENTANSDDQADGDNDSDEDYKDSDEETVNSQGEVNRNGKLKFNTHQCYVCFKLFKTKADLKRHCKDHFDICNEKMLKKCPFCGYVTNLTITKHIRLVHKVAIDNQYGRVKERDTQNGSKYVFEIDNSCQLEIIPSISNLNKIASMKIDEKNRDAKNIFLGTTKLVRKNGDWAVEKQAIDINSDYLLPEFTEEEYKKVKYIGDSYLEKIKTLSVLAKKKGLKILYPCEGCDKICQTLSALKLHNRKHEANPKAFKPKVWKNKILNGFNKGNNNKANNRNRKKYNNNNKNIIVNNENDKTNSISNKTHLIRGKLKVISKNNENSTAPVANRFADPNPVKNKHKCDKELIEFYKTNIKGGDIEFWQFLKIFNKMSRENVNDFKDLESRYDFGDHNFWKSANTNEVTETKDTGQPNTEVDVENDRVIKKKAGQIKKNKFTRAIMISKKEHLRRIELKNQMRKKLGEAKM